MCPVFAVTNRVPASTLVLTPLHMFKEACWAGRNAGIGIPRPRTSTFSEAALAWPAPWPPRGGPRSISNSLLCRFFAACVLDFPAFLSDSLEVLCLNDNHLDAVPPSVCLLKGLSELYLGK